MTVRQPSREVPVHAVSGWGMLALQLLAPFGFVALITWFVGHVRGLEAAAFAARNAGQTVDTNIGLHIVGQEHTQAWRAGLPHSSAGESSAPAGGRAIRLRRWSCRPARRAYRR